MTIITPLSHGLAISTGLIASVILLSAVWRAPWSELLAVQARQHLWIGSIYCLGLVWSFMKISMTDAIIAHPLLMSACTVIFGMRLALVVGFIALLLAHFILDASWHNLGFNYIVAIVVPCVITRLLLFAIKQTNIRNLFLFMLGGGFLGGILSILATAMISFSMLWSFQPELFYASKDLMYLYLLLTFPEGFCNGTIVTTLTVMKPELVKTYNDRYYLDGEQ